MGYTGYQQTPDAIDRAPAPGSAAGMTGQSVQGFSYAPNSQQPVNPSLQSLYDLYNAAVINPANAMANQQTGNLQDQMALLMAGGDLQSQQAQQAADFSLAGLGLQQQNLGINEAALDRQSALLPQQFALQNQGFDLQGEQANYGAGVSRRGLDNNYAARGAFTSEGANQGRGDIQSQLDFSLRGIGLNREGARLSHEEQMAQLGDAKKQLSLSSQQLGLNGQEIKSRLQNALQQIGISSMMSVDQLLSEMYKVQQGQISPISGLFGDIYALSGVTMPDSAKQQVKGPQ